MSASASRDEAALSRRAARGGRSAGRGIRLIGVEAALAAAAFAALCVLVLSFAPQLGVEPDDGAYRASIVAMTEGDFLTLSSAQVNALAGKLGDGMALLFAWRDYMPTFTDASLIAAGSGILLWAMLATEASSRRRTWAGLAGFTTIEFAAFVRYTDVVILGCAVVTVIAAWRLRAVKLPLRTLCWWLASVAVFGAGVAIFDELVYGGPLTTGYQPGEVTFGLGAIVPNLRYMPAHLMQAIPMAVPGLAALAWIIVRRLVLLRAGGQAEAMARRDLWAGLAVAASWFAVWGLYSSYYWTNDPSEDTLQAARFYVPAIGAICPARRLAGDQDSWPSMAGRRDGSRCCRGDVRPGCVLLPRHDRGPTRPLAGLRQRSSAAAGKVAGGLREA